jgi:hypothetical protein
MSAKFASSVFFVMYLSHNMDPLGMFNVAQLPFYATNTFVPGPGPISLQNIGRPGTIYIFYCKMIVFLFQWEMVVYLTPPVKGAIF